SDKIFCQQIDGTGCPCMAQAFSKTIPVHIILLIIRHFGIILFPECNRASLKHSSPVLTDQLQNLCKVSFPAEHIQFIELKIRGCNPWNPVITKYMLHNQPLLSLVRNLKQHSEN